MESLIAYKYITNVIARFHRELALIPLAENLYDPEFDVNIEYGKLFQDENESIAKFGLTGIPADDDHPSKDVIGSLMKEENQNAMKVVFAMLTKNFKYFKKLVVEERIYLRINFRFVEAMYQKVWTESNPHISWGGAQILRMDGKSRIPINNFLTFVFVYTYYLNNSYVTFFLKHIQEEFDWMMAGDPFGVEGPNGKILLFQNLRMMEAFQYGIIFLQTLTHRSFILDLMVTQHMESLSEMVMDTYFDIWYEIKARLLANPTVDLWNTSPSTTIIEKVDGKPRWSEWAKLTKRLCKNILVFGGGGGGSGEDGMTEEEMISDMIPYYDPLQDLIKEMMEGPPKLEEKFLFEEVYPASRGDMRRRNAASPAAKVGQLQERHAGILREIRRRYSAEDLEKQKRNAGLFQILWRTSTRAYKMAMIQQLLEVLDHDYKAPTKMNFEVITHLYFKSDAGTVEEKFFNGCILEILGSANDRLFYEYLKENEETFLVKSMGNNRLEFIFNYIDLIPVYEVDHLSEFILKIDPGYKHIHIFMYLIDTITCGSKERERPYLITPRAHIHIVMAITDYLHMTGKRVIEANGGVLRNAVHYLEYLNKRQMELPGITRMANLNLSNPKGNCRTEAHCVCSSCTGQSSTIVKEEDKQTMLETLYIAVHKFIHQTERPKLAEMFTDWKRSTNLFFSFIFSMFDLHFDGYSGKGAGEDGEGAGKGISKGLDPMVTVEYVESMFKVVLGFNSDKADRDPESTEEDFIDEYLLSNISLNTLLYWIEKRPETHWRINWANILGVISIASYSVHSEIPLYRKWVIDYFRKNTFIRGLIEKKREWVKRAIPEEKRKELDRLSEKIVLRCQHCKYFWYKPSEERTRKSSGTHPITTDSSTYYQTPSFSIGSYGRNPVSYQTKSSLAEVMAKREILVNLPVFYLCEECGIHYHDMCYYGLIPYNKRKITKCAVCDSKKIRRHKLDHYQIEYLVYTRILNGLYFE